MTEREAREKAEDLKGGPGHMVLLSVIFVVPVLKLAWTLGGGSQAREALIAMEPANWPDILIGMLLNEAALAAVLAVVVSHISYAYFAAKGSAQLRPGAPAPARRALATATVLPVAFGLAVGAFHGAAWGLAVALVAYGLRLGLIAEYATGRRERGSGRRSGTAPQGWRERAADGTRAVAVLLAVLVLPVLALAGALDGRSWTTVVECDVNTGHGGQRARMVEFGRVGSGVVGWDVPAGAVVNGTNCGIVEDDEIREPWWRG
ncbi:hypothetical protein [Streptomyces sp. NPDC002851]